MYKAHTYTHIYTCTKHTHIHTYTHVQSTHIYTHIHMYKARAFTHTCSCIKHAHTHILNTHTYTHMLMYEARIYTHICICSPGRRATIGPYKRCHREAYTRPPHEQTPPPLPRRRSVCVYILINAYTYIHTYIHIYRC